MSQLEDEGQSRPQFPLDANSYKIVAEIGAGVSAVVYKALCLPLGSAAVAIKSIDLDKPPRRRASSSSGAGTGADVLDNARRETKIMSLLSHPNILKAHCSFTVGRRLWVVMPFMSAGSLHSIIAAASPGGLPEPAIAPVLRDILRAIAYLHGQGHLHRDIKAGNILVDGDGTVKLADFGVSASLHDSSSARLGASPLTDVAGTPYWMAPEVIHSHSGYGTKADIWSFGITALELAHGRPPLSHLPLSKSLVLKITKRFRFSDYENCGEDGRKDGKKFSRAFKEMVGLCLNQEPAKRPTAEKLLKHSFFKNCNKGLDFLVKNVLQGLPSVEERFRVFKSSSNSAVSDDHEGFIDCDDDDDDDGGGLKEKRRRISGWNFNEDGFELDPVFPTESEDDSASEKAGPGGETVVAKEGELSASSELNPSLLSQAGELAELSLSSPDDLQAGDESGELAQYDLSSPIQAIELYDPDPNSLSHAGKLMEASPSSPGQAGGESDEPMPSELVESNPSSLSQAGIPQDAAEWPPGELGESTPSSPSQGESIPIPQGMIDRERVLRDLLFLRRSIETERTAVSEILRLIGAADQAEPQTREVYLEGVAERARSELEIERKRNSELELEIEFLKMQLQRDE